MKKKIINSLFIMSFIFYVIFLFWNILFKYVSPTELFSEERLFYRGVNLIPFKDIITGYYNSIDIWGNIILFIPLGIYISIFLKNLKITKNLGIILGISLLFEVIQYVLALGDSDVTDLITNTIGGIIGLGVYLIIKKILEDDKKVKTFVTICSTVIMILTSGMLLILFVVN